MNASQNSLFSRTIQDMTTIRLSDVGMEAAVSDAVAVLRAGGVVLYPTDTLYGLGADGLSNEAVDKVYAIKGRAGGKPTHAILPDLAMAEEYAEVTDDARLLAERLPRGQVTLIVKKKAGFDAGVMKKIPTFGFRIPDNGFCVKLVREFGRPVTATSANKSDLSPERSVEKILAQLGNAARDIDLIIDAGELPERLPSTVVDMSGAEPAVIREGAVPAADIWNALDIEADIAG